MSRKMAIPIITVLFIINIAACRRMNITQLINDRFREDPQYYQYIQHGASMVGDFPLLPENYYDMENRGRQDKLQQRDRKNTNSEHEYDEPCDTEIRSVHLNTGTHEYYPPHYFDVLCKNRLLDNDETMMNNPSPQKCINPIQHCVQRTRKLFLFRRQWGSRCWEFVTEPRVMKSGCECMWRVTSPGMIEPDF